MYNFVFFQCVYKAAAQYFDVFVGFRCLYYSIYIYFYPDSSKMPYPLTEVSLHVQLNICDWGHPNHRPHPSSRLFISHLSRLT